MESGLPEQSHYRLSKTATAVLRATKAPDALTVWIDELEAAARAPGTLAEYRRTILKFIILLDGHAPTPLHVRDFLDSIPNHNSKVHALVTLRQWYKFQIGRGLCPEDPTRGIPIPKLRRRQYALLSNADVAALIDALSNDRMMQVMLIVLYHMGIRLGEATRIRVSDVGFDENGYGTIDFPRRKGGDEGFAAFGPEVTAALRPWIAGRSEWVFPHPRTPKSPVSRSIVGRRLANAGRMAGVPGRVTPHRLRHVFITDAVDKAWNPLALQRQLGHSNIALTAWYYKPTRRGLISAYQKASGLA